MESKLDSILKNEDYLGFAEMDLNKRHYPSRKAMNGFLSYLQGNFKQA